MEHTTLHSGGGKEKYLRVRMLACSGTIFLYCRPQNEAQIDSFARAAEESGRRLFSRKDCRSMEPESLAALPGKKAILVQPSMTDFLDRYLERCPDDEQHLLICAPRYSRPPHMSMIFHDFWEERGVDIEEPKREWALHPLDPAELASPVWWLLDIETSGLNREQDSIIALRLARMEHFRMMEEREILARPERPLEPWAERLTGLFTRELEQAPPLEEALRALDTLDGTILLLDRGFTLPFLENAYRRCGLKPCLRVLPLDCLVEQQGHSAHQKAEKLLEALPAVPASRLGTAPKNRDLSKLYQLALALFRPWEVTE